MIIRTKPGTNVCLRCQLRLSGQLRAKPVRFAALGQFRALNLRSTSRLGQAQEDSQKNQSNGQNSGPAGDSSNPNSAKRTSTSAPGAASQPAFRYYSQNQIPSSPLDQLYGIPGSRLRQRTEELPVDSLGRPSEVIVLGEDRSLRYVASRPPELVVDLPPPVDLLAQFNSERGLVGKAEVNQNIESIRPQEKIMSWQDIRDLENILGDGFTVTQLLYYIESMERERMAAQAKDAVSNASIGTTALKSSYKVEPSAVNSGVGNPLSDAPHVTGQDLILRQSPWMPGISDQGDYFDESSLRGYISESFTPKQRVVMNIIRLCWGVTSKELISSVGEMELQVTDANLDLLLSQKGRSDPPLQVISDELIQTDDEKIEIFRSRRAIRITATKGKAEIIAQGIRTALEGVHRIEVPLTPLKSRSRNSKRGFKENESDEFGDPVLGELSRLTNTEVVRISRDKLEIHGMGRNPASKLSTSADAARRLLLSSSDAANHTISKLGYKELKDPVYAVGYEYHHTMSWRDRLRRWTRWQTSTGRADPEARSIEGEDKQFSDLASSAEDKLLDSHNQSQALGSFSVPTQSKIIKLHEEEKKKYELQELNLWSTASVTSTIATVGNVLHQAPSNSGLIDICKPVNFNWNEVTKSRSLFVPSTKNLSRLIGGMSNSTSPSSSLTMKFLPSPWSSQNGEPLSSFPTLEMHFDISRTMKNKFDLARMIAITEDSCHDVMLPDKALDIRFRQTTWFPYIAANLEQYPQITKFLEASQLGQRANVITPPDLVVPIPNFMCSPKSNIKATSNSSTDVRYLFAGLAYRTQINYDFQDWDLRYTSVNSGKADGRRAELTLHPTRKYVGDVVPAEKDHSLDQKLTLAYVKSAYALVETLDSFDDPASRSVGSESSQGQDLGIKYQNLPLVRWYEAQKNTSVPQQFKYFSRSIDFEDGNVA